MLTSPIAMVQAPATGASPSAGLLERRRVGGRCAPGLQAVVSRSHGNRSRQSFQSSQRPIERRTKAAGAGQGHAGDQDHRRGGDQPNPRMTFVEPASEDVEPRTELVVLESEQPSKRWRGALKPANKRTRGSSSWAPVRLAACPRSSRPHGARSTSCPSSRRCAAGSLTSRVGGSRPPGTAGMDTPIFEETDLFARGVGESTDIVQKQMFSFEDQGGRSLTLRPEATASACRAYLEHGMQTQAQPVKLGPEGPFFRHERPQAGRYRQFTQVNAESIGSDSPLVDAELILLASDIVAGSAWRASGCGSGAWARRRPGPPTSTTARLPALPRGRAHRRGAEPDRRQSAARFRRGLRGNQERDGGCPAPDGPPRAGGRRALRRGPLPARPQRRLLRHRPDAGTRARLLHPHPVQVRMRAARCPVGDRRRRPLRRPDRAARRFSRRPVAAGRSASTASPWRWRARPRPRQPARSWTASSSSPRTRTASGRWPWSPSCAARAWRPISTSRAARSRAR